MTIQMISAQPRKRRKIVFKSQNDLSRNDVLVLKHPTFFDRCARRMDPNSILMSPKTEPGLEIRTSILN